MATIDAPEAVTDEEVRGLRLRAQGLAGSRARSVAGAVRAAGALQAQDTRAARLAVRCRSEGLDARAVVRACGEERSVVRTWLMRGTLHMVPAEDVGWMVALLGPRFAAADRRRRHQLGLDDDTCAAAVAAIGACLAHGPLTRAELVREVRARGVAVDPTGQAGAHLVAYAAMQGLICRGAERGGDEPTYVLLEDWVGASPGREPEAAVAELARRYLAGHGPAAADDFAYWAGIGAEQARGAFRLIGAELREVVVGGRPAWTLGPAPLPDRAAPCVRLLPAFDAYLLGYRSRDLALPARFARRIQAGGGWIHPAVAVDGLVVGTWRLRRQAALVEPFAEIDDRARAGIEAEAADVERFLRSA